MQIKQIFLIKWNKRSQKSEEYPLYVINKEHFLHFSSACNSILRQEMVKQAQQTATLPVLIKPFLGAVEYLKKKSFFWAISF